MTRTERLDFIQNITIALLSVTALLLFSRTELFALGWETAVETFQLAARLPSHISAEASLSAPVRLAASTPYERHGELFLTTASPAFQPVRALLGLALDHPETGGQWEEISRSGFLDALDSLSLYCDFLHPLPLSVLAGFVDASSGDARQARSLLLSLEEDGTALYLWDGKEAFSRCPASVPAAGLEEAVGQYRSGSASFAEDHKEDPRLSALSPLSLLPGRTPSLPQLSAMDGSAGTETLLTALRFNPLTNSRYPESNGTEVVVEGSRTVRIRANGSIYYQAGGTEDRTVLSVESAGEVPTPWEAVVGCGAILRSLTGGGGTLYPCEVRQEEGRTYLRFDYQFSGVPVRFSDGRSAAEVTLEGRSVSSLELRPRQYAAAEWESLLLPLPQALGIAALRPGAELTVGYADDGSGQVSAAWMEG